MSAYDPKKITIGVLGSHSAEEVGIAAKAFGFKTIVICQKGREELYTKYNKHLFDVQITLDRFSDLANNEVQERLIELNTVFIPNRSFSVYLGYGKIENEFKIPLYGTRTILRSEERSETKNQYWLLEKAGIKIPKKFSKPEQIDRMSIVKVQQKARPLERAFFYAKSAEEYYEKGKAMVKEGLIDSEALKKARIEEYVLGQKFNANFHSWALKDTFDDFDFLGFDDRKQTNLRLGRCSRKGSPKPRPAKSTRRCKPSALMRCSSTRRRRCSARGKARSATRPKRATSWPRGSRRAKPARRLGSRRTRTRISERRFLRRRRRRTFSTIARRSMRKTMGKRSATGAGRRRATRRRPDRRPSENGGWRAKESPHAAARGNHGAEPGASSATVRRS